MNESRKIELRESSDHVMQSDLYDVHLSEKHRRDRATLLRDVSHVVSESALMKDLGRLDSVITCTFSVDISLRRYTRFCKEV